MVQERKEEFDAKVEDGTTIVKAEDIAVAALFSAVGAVAPELAKDKNIQLVLCFGIGIASGIYATNRVVEYLNKKEVK